MAAATAGREGAPDGTIVRYRVQCSCQQSPFYEGDNEVAARRFFASIVNAAAEAEPPHTARLQRAVIRWEDVTVRVSA